VSGIPYELEKIPLHVIFDNSTPEAF